MYSHRIAAVDLPGQLRQRRRALGMSIAALAAQVGVSPRLISEFELGKRPQVSRLAVALQQAAGPVAP
jgi:transcriptional regulator with XRE-family HTH domain